METAADPFPSDDAAMAHAVALAERGRGAVEPNPCVGAVLTTADRRPISDGRHERYGGPHAEPNALQAAGERARGATLFVTLEPCSHHGKTPPCADAVIAAGVARVVIGTEDPAPHVSGGGIAKLRAAGIEVKVGVSEEACRTLAAPFFKWLATRRPWVTAKWAMTLDGKTAATSGDSKWISSVQSRALVHRWRGESGAVVVGAGTLRADDPHLAPRCRDFGLSAAPRVPWRVIVGSTGTLPPNCRLSRTPEDGPVLVTVLEGAADSPLPDHAERLILPPAPHDPRQVDVLALLDELAARDVYRVFLEGGGTTAGSWFDQGQIDEVRAFVAPKLLGGAAATTPLDGRGFPTVDAAPALSGLRAEPVGDDLLLTALTSVGESPGTCWFDAAREAGQRSAQH
ncbi:bifunctional diaminohydroxyphosphoribosylaminopyrimidine deaminase/5-amino-6-(5-phosphoribosylamino)uracil reductase RibD [Alienimonas californiensis]|uniref:Riboflavin biosynthesis protein RibD n=1 Tax=Alienimonas californiensis TaxID=2527989 RepID=A0A517PDY5_9PLAN|nr:bifunctional diaminohydroxyphosphoribosylaminopyrimidine deaminase/5-amino-6-(5-phosphoribosylamino)uracil reductase RibD [Alienimonas californiensis]QDT17586.1 Riboflavin biosynthesis protein RibD [Alienimonas californiensis]